MSEFVSQLSPVLVYALVAIMVGSESLGIPIPGETTLIAAVLLSIQPNSPIHPTEVFIAAWFGAVVGDSLGFAIGHRYGKPFFVWLGKRFPKSAGPDELAYAKHLFDRYGAWMVFGGRFVALLRMLMGPLAASLGMKYPRFLLANATGAAAWAGSITLLCVFLGSTAQQWIHEFGWVALAIVVVIAVFAVRRIHGAFHQRVAAYAAAHPSAS